MAAVLVAAGIVAAAAPVGAVAPEGTGYWSQLAPPGGGPLPLPSPLAPPPGGLAVAADPSGQPLTISALRYNVGSSGTSATLTLEAAENASLAGASIAACGATSPWQPGDNQGWATAPSYDCGGSPSIGTPSEDGTAMSWVLDVSHQPAPGAFDVVLTPDPNALTAFQAAFAPPDDSSLLPVDAPPADGDSTSAAGDTGDPVVGAAPTGAFVDPGVGFAFDPGPLGTPSLSPAPVGEGEDAGQPSVALRPAAVPGPVPDTRAERVVAVTLLVAMAAGLWWFGGMPARSPRLLGAVAGGGRPASAAAPAERVGGLGRFARTRTAPPNRL